MSISDDRGKPVFAKSLQVLPLDITMYQGLSGAPLVDERGALIGHISGSLNEGGSFSWAIPVQSIERLLSKRGPSVPLETFKWPAFSLMADGWRAATRSFRPALDQPDVALTLNRDMLRLRQANSEIERHMVWTGHPIAELARAAESALRWAQDDDMREGQSIPVYVADSLNGDELLYDRLGSARRSAAALSRAIATRIEVEPRVRATVDTLMRATPQPELSFYSEYVRRMHRLLDGPTEPAHLSLEAVAALDADALLKELAWLSGLRRLSFSSESDIDHFIDRLKRTHETLRTAYDYDRMRRNHAWLEKGFDAFTTNMEEHLFVPVR